MSHRADHKKVAFMVVAETISLLGTCDRKQVGCVIVRDGRCISWGFNGAPPGLPHCDEVMHGWLDDAFKWIMLDNYTMKTPSARQTQQITDRADELIEQFGCRNATHAEANALAAAAKQGISTDGGSLFTTVSPCDTCSRLIIAAGIDHVYYMEEYRDRSGIELLLAAGVTVEQR